MLAAIPVSCAVAAAAKPNASAAPENLFGMIKWRASNAAITVITKPSPAPSNPAKPGATSMLAVAMQRAIALQPTNVQREEDTAEEMQARTDDTRLT